MARRVVAQRLRRAVAGLLLASALALAVRPAGAEWGADLERGADAELVEWIAPDLAAIVAAGPERRPGLVAAFVAGDAVPAIEAVKRFRNPELRSLFRALLDHADWRVVHRALLAIERLEDGAALPRAWDLLGHAEPRLREKAAVSCVRLWGAADAQRPARGRQDVLARIGRETDPLVRACLEALARRIEGSLRVERVADEVRVTRPDGLVLTPYLRRMSTAREVVPGFEANPVARIRRGSVDELPLATRWTAPLRDFGEEKAPAGRVLQPFGYRRNGGRTVHTGADVGALMDGAGLYACAAGIVRFVYTGSDMGTLVVVEHRRSETEIVNVLYMHAADVVHVAAGDRVEPGQLIASIGTGFSFENGGHYAHLHLGAYPGRFDPAHNYGYKPAADGLDDWHDPIAVLRRWIGE